jgi:SnoaL-like domain
MTSDDKLQRLVDERDIEHVLKLYCRAIDRLDVDLLKSVYHPDGTDDHGIFVGNGWEFAEFIIPTLRNTIIDGMHTVTHCTIEIDGRFARSEAYYTAYQLIPGGQEAVTNFFGENYARRCLDEGTIERNQDFFNGGRYLDLFEKRDGQWKILRRKITSEWNTVRPSARLTEQGMMKQLHLPGSRDHQDPLYRIAFPDKV